MSTLPQLPGPAKQPEAPLLYTSGIREPKLPRASVMVWIIFLMLGCFGA